LPEAAPTLSGRNDNSGEARVIVERLDGPAALAALAPALMAVRPAAGRVIGVMCACARRSEAEIRELGALAGSLFHRLVLTEDEVPGAHARGMALGLLTAGALAAGVPSNHIVRLNSEAEAIAGVFAIARPGDLVVVLTPDPARARACLPPSASQEREAA
jgi:cyanophycin synthetase